MPNARAICIREPGGPEVLELGEIELPNPGPSQVMVEVAAAGLNRADCLQRRGFYPAPPGVPADVPGLEFAGVIESIGESVSGWNPGDRVMGIVGGGSMATRVVTESAELMRVPKNLSLEEAAAVPEVFLTAYDAIVLQGGLQAGQTVLLHAVASGVGTAGIQLASAVGATSIGTSRTADKLARCAELGLTHAVHVADGNFADGVMAAAPKGVDVILDTIGAAYLAQNVKVIGKKGRIIVIGLMGGVKAELALGAMLAKRASIHGSVLRSRSAAEKAELTRSFTQEMLGRFATGELKPIIDDVLPMTDVQPAHQRMDANHGGTRHGAGTAIPENGARRACSRSGAPSPRLPKSTYD
jgi:putative PIG3 family NAD(P)H quinone oxidoreductase